MKRTENKVYKLLISLLFAISALSFSGCIGFGGTTSKVNYFTLEYASPKNPDLKPVRSIIKMERFQVSPLFNSEKISYRKNNFQTNEYSHQRWETNPAQMIPYFLFRDIKQSGLFKAVFNHDTGFVATHSVSGNIDEFYEDDRGKTCEAVLSLDIILMAENEPDINKRILFQKRYSARKECARKTPEALAEAMSRGMSELSAQIIKDIYKTLADKI
jgi:ABC-type uncharacterized transport system auxiliary subunit